MKKLFFLLLVLALGSLWADSKLTTAGQGAVRRSLVTWTSGVNSGKMRILFLANNVHLDTAAVPAQGAFKRIDNTADSCSQPVFLTSDTLSGTWPVWQSPLIWAVTYSNDPANSSFVFRLQTRMRRWDGNRKAFYWTAWTNRLANSSFSDITLQDSVLFPAASNVAARTKVSQYAQANVYGAQVRLCPDDSPTTGDDATDSVLVDSIEVITR